MVLNVVVVLGVGRGVVVLWCCGVRCVLSPPQWTPEPVHHGWAGRTEGDRDESEARGIEWWWERKEWEGSARPGPINTN